MRTAIPLMVILLLRLEAMAEEPLDAALADVLSGQPGREKSGEEKLLGLDPDVAAAAVKKAAREARNDEQRRSLDSLEARIQQAAVEREIANLSSDNAEIRDAAEARLRTKGELALGACQKAFEISKDQETKGRLEQVVAYIREVLSLGDPAKTPEEAFHRWLAADLAGDGKAIWSTLSRSFRIAQKERVRLEMEAIAVLDEKSKAEAVSKRFGTTIEEFSKLSIEEAAIRGLTSKKIHKVPAAFRDAKPTHLEIKDRKAYCTFENPPGEDIEVREFTVFIFEDGGWKYDADESETWQLEMRKGK